MADIGRRGLLAAGLSGAVAASLSGERAQAAPKSRAPEISKKLPDIVIVGAGAFGAWSALELRERGARVTLLDSYGAGNARATSGDETRQIRSAYADREIYSRWADRAFTLWHERQAEFGRRLIFANGVLSPNEPAAQFEAEKRIFAKLGIPFEVLSPDECRKRWPQGGFDGDERALYEPRAGTVKARESLIAVTETFVAKGGQTRIAMAKPGASAGGRLTDLALSDGSRLSCGLAIFACGPWLPTVLPDVLTGFVRRTRSEVFYVGSPPGDLSYHWERFPNIWHGGGGYSLSDVDYGYKIAPGMGVSLPMDPDRDERIVSPIMWDIARRFIARRTPGLVGQPMVASRVCSLENSDNGHFIIDRHPGLANLWVAGGGSGHAFKMGPMTGRYIAERVLGIADPEEERALFALSAHKPWPAPATPA
ncbi:NAD(P)/FAD-dependent oxidoreductase [Sphingomonas crocodyli]|uniref:FAD-dependent oxidoreductase n=1 Tax=Sphingomonas crocodyli TaxID=1979270 RepID=A0A437LZQ9_9SPHN|nr:FAD-dependent oxidoreductase [Sphingomonas crocodyli]RVT90855.1 FAD-dependent oxidoreductase [Sphingomonas crocodyli]